MSNSFSPKKLCWTFTGAFLSISSGFLFLMKIEKIIPDLDNSKKNVSERCQKTCQLSEKGAFCRYAPNPNMPWLHPAFWLQYAVNFGFWCMLVWFGGVGRVNFVMYLVEFFHALCLVHNFHHVPTCTHSSRGFRLHSTCMTPKSTGVRVHKNPPIVFSEFFRDPHPEWKVTPDKI